MGKVTAVIAEDEETLRDELRETLASVWPALAIVAEASDGPSALQALEDHSPDVLFLDIHMPGLSGLEVARKASGRSHVVFVTAYDNYAVAAFEQGAVDYVMKPLTPARLTETVNRLKARLGGTPANLEQLLRTLAERLNSREYIRWIMASQGDELRLVTVDEILYFQSDNKYTMIVTRESQSLVRRPLRELIQEVDPKRFWQIHRGTVVNVDAIAGVGRNLRGNLVVRIKNRKETLDVSETYTHLFRQM